MAWVSIHAESGDKTVDPEMRHCYRDDGRSYVRVSLKVRDASRHIVDELDVFLASPQELYRLGAQFSDAALEMMGADAPEGVTI